MQEEGGRENGYMTLSPSPPITTIPYPCSFVGSDGEGKAKRALSQWTNTANERRKERMWREVGSGEN